MGVNFEEVVLRRWSGWQIMQASIAFGACGTLPLLLYALLGPKDGNPIGLGLLAVASLPVAAMGLLIGTVKLCVERCRGPQ